MNTRRLGCFTFQGLVATLLTLLVIAGVSFARGGVLFNPGDLNAQSAGVALGGFFSHADTGGRCAACHAPFWEAVSMDDRCLECHAQVLDEPQDFHGVMLAESKNTACANCHTEHRGAQASLTIMDLVDFPHGEMGFSLQAHETQLDGSPFDCTACHASDYTGFEQATCSQCHTQVDPSFSQAHLEDFGDDCLACHDGVDRFSPGFDHGQLDFVLSGQHAEAACAACHRGAHDLAGLATAPGDCWSCHRQEDVHQGQLGTDCQACHSPEGWQAVTFDHGQTAFPLTGKHNPVDCRACHLPDLAGAQAALVFTGTPQDCFACHAGDDAHQGQYGAGCEQCHTSDGWEVVSFDHSLAAFQLTGAHQEVTCSGCHTSTPSGMVFQGAPHECQACHTELTFHAGLFSTDCQTCHTTQSWSPARFDSPHLFPINHGESGGNDCKVCHPTQLQAYLCYGCHEHTEADVSEKHLDEGIRDFQNCVRCHPTGQEEEGGED